MNKLIPLILVSAFLSAPVAVAQTAAPAAPAVAAAPALPDGQVNIAIGSIIDNAVSLCRDIDSGYG